MVNDYKPKYIIYGVGRRLERHIDCFESDQIICFADRNHREYSDGYAGKEVIAPDNIGRYNYDIIVVSSNIYFNEILKELIFHYSVPVSSIVSMDYILRNSEPEYELLIMRIVCDFLKRYDKDGYNAFFCNAKKNYLEYIKECMYGIGIRYLFYNNELNNDLLVRNNTLYINGSLLQISTDCKIRIFVVAHKDYAELGDPVYKTNWVGDKYKEKRKNEKDEENINHLNPVINECTALYWIWKHEEDYDYIGLNHYRRYFESPMNPGVPLQKWEAYTMLKGCDVITAQAEVFEMSVKDKLGEQVCEEAFAAGINALYRIFDHRSEAERNEVNLFLDSNVIYPCQMFIMRRELMDEYCNWLFPILFELIEKVEIKDEWDAYSKRIIGFIAERLFTVWLLLKEYRIEELPILLTDNSGPYGMN